MIENIIVFLTLFIKNGISGMGHAGIIMLMAIESACIPLPSEIIMPFAGFLVAEGRFSLWAVSVSGAFGCLVGSVAAYVAGIYGGRPFVEKFGKYFLVSVEEMDVAERWFKKYGDLAIFFSRLMPVIRTFISLPAGIARMNFVKFMIYSFVGSLPWCWFLAYLGMKAGKNWDYLEKYFHRIDVIIVLAVVGLICLFLWKKFIKNVSSGRGAAR